MLVDSALTLNPADAQEHITVNGSIWYWTVFSVMLASTFAYTGMMFTVPKNERLFHYITIGIVFTASVAYFSMASDLGVTPIGIEFVRTGLNNATTRQIFYARYIDWFITTPLLLLDLLLLSGLPYATILFTIFMDEVMVVTGLLGALTASRYKWGYFTIGCFAFFFVVWQVVFVARKSARAIGSDVHRLFVGISLFTLGLWTLYPISWGLSEGGSVISSDGEAYFYGVLDLLAKPVFGFWLLFGHRGIGFERLGLTGWESMRPGSSNNAEGSHEKRSVRTSPVSTMHSSSTRAEPRRTDETSVGALHGDSLVSGETARPAETV